MTPRPRIASGLGLFLALAMALAAFGFSAVPPASAVTSSSPVPTTNHSPATDVPPADKNATTPAKITFGIQPALAKAVDARPFYSYVMTPGGILQDHVALLNFGLTPITLGLGTADALNTASGGFSLIGSGQQSQDAGSWIGLPPGVQAIHVPARASESVPPAMVIVAFQVKVPLNASPGDHAAGVFADLTTTTEKTGRNIRLDQRVAARVYIRVAGPLHPDLVIAHVRATYQGTPNPLGRGSDRVSFTVRNSGNVKLGARLSVDERGLLGLDAAGSKIADLQLIFPGNSVQITTVVPAVWPTVRIKTIVTALPLRLEGDADGPIPAIHTTVSSWAVPWVLIAIIVLALIFISLSRSRRRRRARSRRELLGSS